VQHIVICKAFVLIDHKLKTSKKSIKIQIVTEKKKVIKGVWRMPRLSEAMKDVISCDKLRVAANKR
jgi:hypothetical protein